MDDGFECRISLSRSLSSLAVAKHTANFSASFELSSGSTPTALTRSLIEEELDDDDEDEDEDDDEEEEEGSPTPAVELAGND